MLRNKHNWLALPRALAVFDRPLSVLGHIRRGSFPTRLRVRAPTGTFAVELRNIESLKTCYSIFAREITRHARRARRWSSTLARTSVLWRCISCRAIRGPGSADTNPIRPISRSSSAPRTFRRPEFP